MEEYRVDFVERGARDLAEAVARIGRSSDSAAKSVDALNKALDNKSPVKTVDDTTSAVKGLGAAQQKTTQATSALRNALLGLASAGTVSFIVRQTDAWTLLTNQLRASGIATQDLAAAQKEVTKIATETNSDLSATGKLYAQLTRNAKELGASTGEINSVVRTVNKSFQLSGASVQEASGAIRQLNQAFASGVLRGDEFNSVMEQAPIIGKLIAKEFGTSTGALRKLAEQGQLDANRVFKALLKGGKEVETLFAGSTKTVSQSITNLQTSFTGYIGKTNEASGVTGGLAKAIDFIAQNIEPIADNLIVFGSALLVYKGATLLAAGATTLLNAVIAASPIGRLVALAGLAAAAFVSFNISTAEGKKRLTEIGTSILTVGQNFVTWAGKAIASVMSVGTSVAAFAVSLKDGFVSAFTGVYDYLASWVESIRVFFVKTIPDSVSSGLNIVRNTFVDIFDRVKSFVGEWVDRIKQFFTDLVEGAKKQLQRLVDFARDVFNRVANMRVSTTMVGESRRTTIDGARAAGGPVRAGGTYLVGENGPELFSPGQSGQIIPNSSGGTALAANDNEGTSSRASVVRLLSDGVAAGVDPLMSRAVRALEAIDERAAKQDTQTDRAGGGTSSSAGGMGSSAGSSIQAATQRTRAVSDINNFVDPNAGVTSSAPVSSGSSISGAIGGGGSAEKELGYYDVDNAAKGLQKLYNNYVYATSQILQQQVMGLNMWGGNSWGVDQARDGAGRAQVRYELALAKVDSSIRQQVETLVKARAPTASVVGGFSTTKFRSGGGLRVMGSGAPDSRLVQMAVSPGEQIDVQTRKQRREEMGMLGGGNVNNNVTLNITTQDADSFRRSEKQIAQQARALLRRGA
jgi:tape measure domain-containing protein